MPDVKQSIRRSIFSTCGGRRIFPAKKQQRKQRGQEGNDATGDIRQFRGRLGGLCEKQRGGKDGANDARQRAEALGDAQVRALFVSGRLQRNHAENRCPVQSGTDGQHGQENQQASQVGLEGQRRQADRKNNQAGANQTGFAKRLDEPMHRALHQHSYDSGVGEKISHLIAALQPELGRGFRSQHQRKCGFKTGETKRGEEENDDEQAELGLAERVSPLGEFGPECRRTRPRASGFRQE